MRTTLKSVLVLLLGLAFLSLSAANLPAQTSGPGTAAEDNGESRSVLPDPSVIGPALEKNMDPKNSIKLSLKSNKSVARPGDEITITAEADQDCYLSVISFSDNGKVKVLWPMEGEAWAAKVKANTPVLIPPSAEGLKTIADGKSRLERIVAVAVDRKNAIFTDKDFEQIKGTQLRTSLSDRDDMVNEFSDRITNLDPSVKWGTAEVAVQIAGPGESVQQIPAVASQDGRAKVTLHIFSGRPDPSWLLTREQAMTLAEKLRSSQTKTLKAMPKVMKDLGYRGFSIEGLSDLKLKGGVTLYNNIVAINGRKPKSLKLPPGELEQWLLETAGDALHPEVKNAAKTEIVKPKPKRSSPGS